MDFEAFWIPSELSNARALALAERCLRDAKYPGERVIVLNTVKHADDVPELAAILDSYPTVSPRTHDRPSGGGHAVLAPWVVGDALELAEELASSGGGLLVIDSDPRHDSVQAWIARTDAVRLVEAAQPSEELGEDGINVFWEPSGYAPEGVEAELPDGTRVQPVPFLGGRRVGFDRGLPRGTLLVVGDRVLGIVGRHEDA